MALFNCNLLITALYRGMSSLNVEPIYRSPYMNMHITTALITGLFLSSVAFGEPPVEDLLAGPTIEKEQDRKSVV
jgi:hypothetical protein